MKEPIFLPWPASDVATELARRLSHDLRSPFASSIGVLQLVVEDQDLNKSRDLLETLLESNRHHERFMGSLLFWSRMELGIYRPAFQSIPLANLAETLAPLGTLAISPSLTGISADLCLEWLEIMAGELAQALAGLGLANPRILALAGSDEALIVELHWDGGSKRPLLDRLFPVTQADPELPGPAAFGGFLASRLCLALGITVETGPGMRRLQIPLRRS